MWFNGPIVDAIGKSKTDEKLLIVFIHGDDADSQSMLNAWNSSMVQSTCEHGGCIALKFDVKSIEAKQFSEFYPVTKTPISFFIDPSGVSIEISIAMQDENKLNEKVHQMIEIVRSKYGLKTRTEKLTSSVEPSETITEKVEKMRQKNKDVQENKQVVKAEEEKEREAKQRDEGKSYAQVKENQQQKELFAAAEQRKKDKNADKERLQFLREQIAADRAEKAAKFSEQNSKETAELAKQRQQQLEKIDAENKDRLQQLQENMKTTKINFRLSDGQSIIESFDSDHPFDDARRFIAGVLDLRGQFTLVQMDPKREFTPEDWPKNFKELNLAPRSVVMVVQGSGSGKSKSVLPYRQNFFMSILSLMALPVITIFNWIYSFVFPPQNLQNARPSNTNNRQNTNQSGSNVNRLANPNDQKDDNATWNGNSTQQL